MFYKRAGELKAFFRPGFAWDPDADDYGLDEDDTGTAQDRAENLEIILTQLGGHLPFPYLTQKFTTETHNWSEVWNILYTHYGVMPNQQSFLKYARMQKKDDETPLTFYERLCHHGRSHLAPGDTMNTTLLNHIALDWLKGLDLVEAVETEFGNELKQGTQLSALVPRIAHQVETLRRRSGPVSYTHLTLPTKA